MQGTSKEKEHIGSLLKNIAEGLKTHSIEELNHAIISHLNKKGSKHEEKHWILDRVCQEHNITRHILIFSKEHGEVMKARRLAYCLLHDLLDLSMTHIATRIFKKTTRIVTLAISYKRELNLRIPEHREFQDRYDKINQAFVKQFLKNEADGSTGN